MVRRSWLARLAVFAGLILAPPSLAQVDTTPPARPVNVRVGQFPPFFIANATALPQTAAPGESVAIAADFGVSRPQVVAAYFEIRDAADVIVETHSWSDQAFAAEQVRRYTWSFPLPASLAAGTYRVNAAIFAPDWSASRLWKSSAAVFQVAVPGGCAPPCRSFYVDSGSGSDNNSGTATTAAWKSLGKVNGFAFQPGDVVHFKRGGVWTGNLAASRSGTASSPITYKAYGSGAAPLIRNPGVNYGSAITVTADWSIVQDFLLSDAHEAGVLLQSGADRNVVRNNEVTATGIGVLSRGQFNLITGNNVHDLRMIVNDSAKNSDYGAVCFWIEAPNNEISYNSGVACKAPSIDFGYDGGFVEVWQNGDNSFIHHNYARNTNGFFELGGSGSGSAIGVRVAYNVIVNVTGPGSGTSVCFNTGSYDITVSAFRFENNTWLSNEGHSDAYRVFGCRSDLSALEVRNNIFYSDIQIANTGSFTRTRNLYYMANMVNGSGVGYSLGAGEQLANPQFVNLLDGVLRLLATSPAIDAGMGLGYGEDIEGTPVPQGSSPDIGAYEFSPN